MDPTPFYQFIQARHQVHLARVAKQPWPWTDDTILQTYRFCNVYRELDRVTRWVRTEWVRKHEGQGDIWFQMAVARVINWPDTLHMMPAVVPWRPDRFLDTVRRRIDNGAQVFGPAYIVSTNGISMPKHEYLAERVLTPLWQAREHLRPRKGDKLADFHARLLPFHGMGTFMAAQVVADVKNTRGGGLPPVQTPDWMTWAAPGPGSLRGLNRLLGNGPIRTGINTERFIKLLNELRAGINGRIVRMGWTPLCAQDIQNCLCEFDKYERVRLGQGTPKQKYIKT